MTDLDLHGRLRQVCEAIATLHDQADAIDAWGDELARTFAHDGKVLVAGNGGSAALAAHLTGELVGRFLDERMPLPAVWLGADQAALTAILNDYGPEAVFERQVRAFARAGDVVILLSTSGRSRNLLTAAAAAHERGAQVWSLTGPRPNPLAEQSHRTIAAPGGTPVVQEVQQVIVHLVCAALDERLLTVSAARRAAG